MVQARFGLETLDHILTAPQLASGGAYTAVGTYDSGEMVSLVRELARVSGIPAPDLERAFGEYLFSRFPHSYPYLFEQRTDAFGMLEQIDNYIHVEVRKLYADAELPRVMCKRIDADTLRVTYVSQRPFGDVAEGLMRGCIAYHDEAVHVERQNVEGVAGAWTRVEFILTKTADDGRNRNLTTAD